MRISKRQNMYCAITLLLAVIATGGSAAGQQRPEDACTGLNAGYCHMYNLQFPEAHMDFAEWGKLHPQDPMGPVSDAAAYLFSEFERLHILEAEFFTNNKNFESPGEVTPDPEVKQKFEFQLEKTGILANKALSQDPKDENAIFANIMILALRGDYVALIEKRNLAGLSFLKQARVAAEAMLKEDPNYYDAYIAIGIENYLLSQKPAPVRWILHMGGAKTDKNTGLENLRLTAAKGHFLQPYARLLLAIAALREQDRNTARDLLQGLAQQFPNNRLYAKELAKLQVTIAANH